MNSNTTSSIPGSTHTNISPNQSIDPQIRDPSHTHGQPLLSGTQQTGVLQEVKLLRPVPLAAVAGTDPYVQGPIDGTKEAGLTQGQHRGVAGIGGVGSVVLQSHMTSTTTGSGITGSAHSTTLHPTTHTTLPSTITPNTTTTTTAHHGHAGVGAGVGVGAGAVAVGVGAAAAAHHHRKGSASSSSSDEAGSSGEKKKKGGLKDKIKHLIGK